MGIIAANIIIGGDTVLAAPKVIERSNEGSFQALREKLHTQQVNETSEKSQDTVPNVPQRSKKIKKVDSTLIQYKESAFLSDMLSSSKD